MEKFIIGAIFFIGGIAALVALSIVTPFLYAAGGYFTGWALVNLFPQAGGWVVSGLRLLHVEVSPIDLPVVGAALGFVGAFFKSTQTNNNKK